MSITYEWVAEDYDEWGDIIIDPQFSDTLEGALEATPPATNVKYALVRFEGDADEGIIERHYAYINEDFELPEFFDDSRIRVPVQYDNELVYKKNQRVLNP